MVNGIRRFRIVALASAAALATLASAAARADIFAATCVRGPTSQDIAIFNASLGTSVALPGVVNTADGIERHPSISSDGRRLAFARLSGSSQRLIVADLSTGQTADLFTGFEIAQSPIFGSAITPDGTAVATGRPFRSFFSFRFPVATLTSLSSFPSGPFSRTTLSPTRFNITTGPGGGHVEDIATGGGGNLLALHLDRTFADSWLALVQRDGSSSLPLRMSDRTFSQPALAAVNPASVLFVQQLRNTGSGTNVYLDRDIAFRPATLAGFPGTPTLLRLGVSTPGRDESQPALTADGRYVGFVRDAEGANDRLFVWDSQTQIFLNPNGIDLGAIGTASGCRSLSLYTRSVISSSAISQLGNVNATLTQASSIGIFVQRIVGTTKVLGRKAYELETVGRFPLGMYGAGNVFTHWDFEVNGEPLPAGRYLVTLRAVEGDLVRELGEPQVLRIDMRGGTHMLGKDPR